MSKNRQETIADIVAAMMDESHAGDASCLEWVGAKLRHYADRIEAAHKREMADEKRISDAVIQSLRDKKLEMAGEIAAKDEEIERLRAALKPVLELDDNYDGHWPFSSLAVDAVKKAQRIYKEVTK